MPNSPDPSSASPAARAARWLARWGPVLPLLIAEATIWIGFGALLPVLPLWITEHGTDLPTLGIVIAAWPAARLVGEPLFGRLADTGPRKAMMVTGLVAASVFAILPLYLTGPLAFLVLRALAGTAAALYDPAARGYLMDAVPPERHGETFGMYAAAQMGGLMLGPVVGGVTAGLAGDPAVVFWVAGIALLVSAVVVAARVPDLGRRAAGPALFALVSRAAPPGRSSTAQGVFGAAGTVGTIVASLGSGVLATVDLRLPLFATAFIALGALLLGLLVGHGRIARAMAPVPSPSTGETAVSAGVAAGP